MPYSKSAKVDSRWAHRVAVALACVTFPLIWVGGLVTTYDAGMAVPDWPTTYGYNMFLYPLSTWLAAPWDLFIEHGHRLLGSLAGLLTILFLGVVWRTDTRTWMKGVAVAALVLVCYQGFLGGMRVRWDSNLLARLHGCTGPLFFGLSIAMCGFTSRLWFQPDSSNVDFSSQQAATRSVDRGLLSGVWTLVVLSYVQLVLGAHLRHPNFLWSPTVLSGVVVLHVALAVGLVVQAMRLTWQIVRKHRHSALFLPGLSLSLLVLLQFALGVGTWTMKYGWPQWLPGQGLFAQLTVRAESMPQVLTVTAHVATGSLFLAASVWMALRTSRIYAAQLQETKTSQPTDDHVNRRLSTTVSVVEGVAR